MNRVFLIVFVLMLGSTHAQYSYCTCKESCYCSLDLVKRDQCTRACESKETGTADDPDCPREYVVNFGDSTKNILPLNASKVCNAVYSLTITNCTSLPCDLPTSFSRIAAVSNNLNIINNPALTSLEMLKNLQKVKDCNANFMCNGYLGITNNPLLVDLRGLSKLQDVLRLDIQDNAKMTSLSGLEIQSIEGFTIKNLPKLQSLKELKTIKITGICETCHGTIEIENNPSLLDLTGLDNLVKAGGGLIIANNTGMTSLQGLNRMTSTGNYFSIHDLPKIKSLEGLENLKTAVVMYIYNNPILLNLLGLKNLAQLQVLSINDNAKMISLQGINKLSILNERLEVHDLPSLTSLEGLNNVKRIGDCFNNVCNGVLEIYNNPLLLNLNGLTNLARVSDFKIFNNIGMRSLQGMPNLKSFEGVLQVYDLPLVKDLQGLKNFKKLSALSIRNLPMLVDLDGLSNLVESGLEVSHNIAMTSLKGIENNVNMSYGLFIHDLPKLESLKGLENVREIGSCGFDYCYTALRINNNPLLKNLTGLSNLKTVKDGLEIYNNSAMTSIKGMTKLQSVENGIISIHDLPLLKTLEGMESLERVGFCNGVPNLICYWSDIQIYNNPLLIDLKGFTNLVELRGGLEVYNNKAMTSLKGFSKLKRIGEIGLDFGYTRFEVKIHDLSSLESLEGLENLERIGLCDSANFCYGLLSIYNNPLLKNLTGLTNLVEINGGFEIFNNTAMASLKGVYNLNKTAALVNGIIPIGFNIHDLPLLESLEGLENVKQMGMIQVYNNTNLLNMKGLSNLIETTKGIEIANNPMMTSLEGLEKLTRIGSVSNTLWSFFSGLRVHDLLSLKSLKGLDNLKQVGRTCKTLYCNFPSISIKNNPSLLSLYGLTNLVDAIDGIEIINNSGMISMDGMKNLTTIGEMVIEKNSRLPDLVGLDKLREIHKLQLVQNTGMKTLAGMSQLENVTGSVKIGPFMDKLQSFKFGNVPKLKVQGIEMILGRNLSKRVCAANLSFFKKVCRANSIKICSLGC